MQNEKRLEQKLVKKVKELGGLCLKWTSPGTVGVPDRLVIIHGRVLLVEVKDKKGKLSERQKYLIAELAKREITVTVIYNDEELDTFLESL
jgi:Holliday junction resolvase